MLLDDIDLHILSYMRKNARITINDLASKIGVRRSTIYAHLSKLEEQNKISGYSVIPNFKQIGANITAFVLLTHQQVGDYQGYKNFANQLAKIPYITEIYAITGEFDYILKIRVSNLEEMGDQVFNPLKRIEGVSRMQTLTVFYTQQEELSNSVLPFDYQ